MNGREELLGLIFNEINLRIPDGSGPTNTRRRRRNRAGARIAVDVLWKHLSTGRIVAPEHPMDKELVAEGERERDYIVGANYRLQQRLREAKILLEAVPESFDAEWRKARGRWLAEVTW